MFTDVRYMRRALSLARNGELDASPNPMVGAVIVGPEDNIIGEGWHRRCGEGHAEVNAVASVEDKNLLRDSTMYVTLEPCAHYGKTPPCAEMIVKVGIPRVVVGCRDPFAKVAGRGIAILREAGVEVEVGMLEQECRDLNRKFMTAHQHHRPFITLKWAESLDGYIDGKISTLLTSMFVHRLRATHDAILVGSGTIIADSPSLTTRFFAGKNPIRIIMDRRGRLGLESGEDESGRLIVMNDYSSLSEAMHTLYEAGITSVLVEGGSTLLRSFLNEDLWDVVRVERSEKIISGQVKAPRPLPSGFFPHIETIDQSKIYTYIR